MAEGVSPVVCGGLNDISDLATSDQHKTRWIPYSMEKTSSRIPKLGFGFRKPTPGKSGHLSEGNSPRGVVTTTEPLAQPPARPMTPSDSHSAPGSQNTSPNLSRSKSLRAPKSGYHAVKIQPSSMGPAKSHASSSTGNAQEQTSPRLQVRPSLKPPGEAANEKVESLGFSRARSKTMGSGIARPSLRSSARPMSPRVAWQGREKAVDVEQEDDEDDEYFNGSPQPDTTQDLSPLKRDRRTKSFSAKAHTRLTNGTSPSSPSSPSHSSTSPMARANSMRRSKTPTSLTSSIRSQYGGERVGNGGQVADRTPGGRLVRTGSQGHMAKLNTKVTPSPQQQDRVAMRRAVSSSKPPRPLSSYVCEEVEQGDDETSVGEKGLKGKRSHSSLDHHDATPTSLHTGSGRVTPTRTSRFLAVKHRTNSLENSGGSGSGNRPRSATAHYQQARRLSNTSKETAASKPELSMDGRRDSTPISGRSTPVSKAASRDSTDGGVVSTTAKSTGLPPRTPYRVARTKAAPSNSLAGMNELEGSVLLEADDYRRLVNEVKALKTALLKLKRELQEGSEEPATPSAQVGRSKTTPTSTGQMTPVDQSKKLRAVGKERDAATDEVSRLRKELKSRDSRIESMSREMAELREKNKQAAEELKCVSEHRNRLVDKVERLHAEKHQIEARLNTLERASMYEQTWSENWLDELDGEDNDALRRSLENDNRSFSEGGRTKGSSGSDVVDSGMQSDGDVDENSEPEGVAISYTGSAVM